MIVKMTIRFEMRNVINNTDQIKLLKYKNFVNAVYSKNITIYQFKYFFTNKKTEHVDIVKKKKSIKLSMKYQNYVDVFNKKKRLFKYDRIDYIIKIKNDKKFSFESIYNLLITELKIL